MASLPWYSPLVALPADGTEVWIRVYWWWGTPVLATYEEAAETFATTVTRITLPVWAVSRWREQ